MSRRRRKLLIVEQGRVVGDNDEKATTTTTASIDCLAILKLKHPRHSSALFALATTTKGDNNANASSLYELVSYGSGSGSGDESSATSVFIDDTVQKTAAVHFVTRFNPIYMWIDYFMHKSANGNNNNNNKQKPTTVFKSRDELVAAIVDYVLEGITDDDDDDDEQKSARQLLTQVMKRYADDHLTSSSASVPYKLVFDIQEKGGAGEISVRLVTNKCVKWLRDKVERIETYLAQVASDKQQVLAKKTKSDTTETTRRTHAFELVAQYVCAELSDALEAELGLNSSSSSEEAAKSATTAANAKTKTEPTASAASLSTTSKRVKQN